MTTEPEPSLRDLFLEPAPSPKLQSALFESNETLVQLRDRLSGELPGSLANGFAGGVLEGLTQVLDIPLSKILAGAWNGSRSLSAYADPTKHPPDEILLVPLEKHTINSSHKPHLDVLVNGNKVRSVEFEIKLSLEIQAAVLKIQGGRIHELQAGTCKAKGKLSCGGAVLKEAQSQVVQLPATIRFEGGIPIRVKETVPS